MRAPPPLPILASLLYVVGLAAACVEPPSDTTARVDEIFAQWDSSASPGCALSVSRTGDLVLSRAWGMADLEHDIPNTPSTIFEGGSLAKQFTSAAVVLLALDGKLSLDDDVRTYIPEVRDYGSPVTLRRLMTHTSGMRDWGSVASISGWGRGARSHRHAHVLDIVSRQSALNFEPGHEYSYSNTGYNLLAVVVDRVSGMPFAQFSRERIFEPLGMSDTQWRDDYRRLVPRRSTAYSASDDGFLINRPIEYVHGNGGILSTVGDLQTWNAALTDGRLGGEEFVRMMHGPGRPERRSDNLLRRGSPVAGFRGRALDHPHRVDRRLSGFHRPLPRPAALDRDPVQRRQRQSRRAGRAGGARLSGRRGLAGSGAGRRDVAFGRGA